MRMKRYVQTEPDLEAQWRTRRLVTKRRVRDGGSRHLATILELPFFPLFSVNMHPMHRLGALRRAGIAGRCLRTHVRRQRVPELLLPELHVRTGRRSELSLLSYWLSPKPIFSGGGDDVDAVTASLFRCQSRCWEYPSWFWTRAGDCSKSG